MKKRKNKKILWISVGVLLCIVIISVAIKSMGALEVETIAVQSGEIRQYLEDIAVVQSKEKRTIYVESAGKITNAAYEVGDIVKKGDKLLTIDTGDLELQLKDADARIEAAKAQLKGTEFINYANKIEIAKAAVKQAEVTFESASRDFEITKKLFETGSISEAELNTVQDIYKGAQAALNTANLQLNDIKGGTPEYVKSGYASQLEQAMILRDNIVRNIEKMQIISPMDGVVLEKFVEENSLVVPGTEAFIIADVQKLEIEANILADDGYKVQLGNEVEISGRAIEDKVVNGKVVKIAPAAKTVVSSLGINQRRVPVTIELTDNVVMLKPGYSVDIKIITDVKKDVLNVPDTSVFDYNGKSCVIAVESGKAVIREVKKGMEGNRLIEITEGLNIGDIILEKPNNNIKEGTKIALIKSIK